MMKATENRIKNLDEYVRFFVDRDDINRMIGMTGYDDCIIGVVERPGSLPLVAYDTNKIIDQLQLEGMNYDDAYQWWNENMLNGWVGPGTPAFVILFSGEKMDSLAKQVADMAWNLRKDRKGMTDGEIAHDLGIIVGICLATKNDRLKKFGEKMVSRLGKEDY
tara:strand:- start:207 stop:695 length:489 start_codon:yes stop_codon:yes gene_type:complete